MSNSIPMLALDKIVGRPTMEAPNFKPYKDHIRHRILLADETEFRDRPYPSDLKKEFAWIVLNGTGKLLVIR